MAVQVPLESRAQGKSPREGAIRAETVSTPGCSEAQARTCLMALACLGGEGEGHTWGRAAGKGVRRGWKPGWEVWRLRKDLGFKSRVGEDVALGRSEQRVHTVSRV